MLNKEVSFLGEREKEIQGKLADMREVNILAIGNRLSRNMETGIPDTETKDFQAGIFMKNMAGLRKI